MLTKMTSELMKNQSLETQGTFISRILIFAYEKVRGLGLLDFKIFKKVFLTSYFFYKKYFEDSFENLTSEYPELFHGGHVIDVGANIGYTSLLFAKAVSKGYKVYSFEPETWNFDLMTLALQRSKYSQNILTFRLAVGDQKKRVKLWNNKSSHSDHRILTEELSLRCLDNNSDWVDQVNLDNFFSEMTQSKPIQFIKIDVQGYELPVCLGITRILEQNPTCSVAVEYCPTAMSEMGFNPKDLLKYFDDRKYDCYIIKHSELAPYTEKELGALIEKRGYVDVLFTKNKFRKIL